MSKDAELMNWLSSMGVTQQFSKQDLQSGRTVANILKATNRESKIQLQDGNSAITRVSNWNTLIQHLKPLNIKLTQDDKTKIINGNHDLVFKIISKLRDTHQKTSKQTQINLKDIDPRKDVKEAQSLLELFLLAIIKHFNLSPKESLSLLSNDSKYLAHILAKGLKNDFRPIDNLILEFNKNLEKIIGFSKNKQNEVFFLKSVKPALISKSQIVAEHSFELLLNYLEHYDKDTRLKVTKEHLTPTVMLIIRRHPQLTQNVISSLLNLCDYQPSLLTDMCQNISKNELSMFFEAIWKSYTISGHKSALLDSFTFQNLVQQISNSLDDPDLVLSSLKTCVFLMLEDFDSFDRLFAQKLIMEIRQILLSKETQNIELVHLYFCLMEKTGQQKHPLAPIIYKLLVSRLANANDNEYQVLLLLFQQLLDDLPSIPPSPIIDTLTQRSDLKVQQPQLAIFAKILSITTEGRVAVSIYNIVSRHFVEETGIGKDLTKNLVKVIANFKDEEILIDMTGKLIKVCLALYFANAKKMAEKRKPISHKVKIDTQEAATKVKMLQIEYFLKKVIQLGISDINTSAEPLVCFSYIQIAGLGKDLGRGLQKIVALLGDSGKLIAKYQKELNIDEGQKKSRIKNHSPTSPQSPYSPEEQTPNGQVSSQNVSGYMGIEKKIGSPINLHPMSLSLANVKADAYIGLEKYAKKHQVKSLAEQSKRYQAIQAAQELVKQKKAYEKKVVLERGLRLRGVSETEISYIFEFDSKQVYAESNQLYLNFYTAEAEEQRDAQGVQQAIKRYEKALKVYFKAYSGKKDGFHTRSFDEYQDRTNLMHSSAVYKLLKDHGMESFITPRQIKTLARKISYKSKNVKDDPELLDFEGFKEMTIQMSFTMFTRPPKDFRGRPVAEMLEQLFSMFKLYASENRINAQLFEQPEACYTGQEQAIRLLNKRLQQNPDYILPEGYKKITENRILFDHKIFLEAMSPTYKQVYEVLDEIFFEGLKIHIIEPFTQETKICRARPNVYSLEYTKMNEVESKHLPVHLKKEVAKFPMMQRPIAKDAALALADIVRAIQLNQDEVGVKIQNAAMRHKRQKEQQLKRIKEEQQMKRLNATRQMRSAIQTFKATRQQKLHKIQEEKQQQARKKRQKEEYRERRDRQMKQKLQEYNQKKKQDQEARKAGQRSKKENEKAQFERKRRQLEQTRRKIQQKKKQKQDQLNEKKLQEQQQKKRKRKQQRQKFERQQNEKKQRVEQYKKKKGSSKVIDAPAQENKEDKQGQKQNEA